MLTQTAPSGRPDAAQARATVWRLLSTVLLVSMLVLFAIAHFVQWRDTGRPSGLGLVGEELLVATLFLLRRSATRTSSSPVDWIAAALGSWLVLLMRPGGASHGLAAPGLIIQLVGLAGVVISLSTLGRSFGIVAADRGLKTGGPYSIVRHPTYLCYLVTQTGYLLQYPTVWNLGIVLIVTVCQVRRIRAEETMLVGSPGYAGYRGRVRYRLVPGIW